MPGDDDGADGGRSAGPARKRARATLGGALEEVMLGGLSTALACLISNPFDTVKTRMQLQGELQAKGAYRLLYRNVVHAAWTIARTEGLWALQKGLGPAIVYQFFMNGVRLGTYQTLVNAGFTRPKAQGGEAAVGEGSGRGRSDFARSVAAGALGGALGGIVASPLYLVRACRSYLGGILSMRSTTRLCPFRSSFHPPARSRRSCRRRPARTSRWATSTATGACGTRSGRRTGATASRACGAAWRGRCRGSW